MRGSPNMLRIHGNGTYSYRLDGHWTRNVQEVPQAVLNELPEKDVERFHQRGSGKASSFLKGNEYFSEVLRRFEEFSGTEYEVVQTSHRGKPRVMKGEIVGGGVVIAAKTKKSQTQVRATLRLAESEAEEEEHSLAIIRDGGASNPSYVYLSLSDFESLISLAYDAGEEAGMEAEGEEEDGGEYTAADRANQWSEEHPNTGVRALDPGEYEEEYGELPELRGEEEWEIEEVEEGEEG